MTEKKRAYAYQTRAEALSSAQVGEQAKHEQAFDIAVDAVLEVAGCHPHKIAGVSGEGGGWHRFGLEISADWRLGCDLAARLGISTKEGHTLVSNAIGSLTCADWDEIPSYIAQRNDYGEAS